MVVVLPVPLLTQEGKVLPSSKCIVTALRLVVRLGESLFPLFTPKCQHSIHHARNISLLPCLLSSFCLTSDGGTTVCDTAQVDHMVESLLLHRNPLALSSALSSTATLWCKFSVVNPVLVTHTGPELVNAIRFHVQPAARHSVPLSPLLRRASLVMSTHRLRSCALLYLLKPPPRLPQHTTQQQQMPPPQLSILEFIAVVFYETPPLGARPPLQLHEDLSDAQCPSDSVQPEGESPLMMPPRSSPLPSFSNGVSFPKPSRRAIFHFLNPSTLVLRQYQQLQWP